MKLVTSGTHLRIQSDNKYRKHYVKNNKNTYSRTYAPNINKLINVNEMKKIEKSASCNHTQKSCTTINKR